MHFLPQKVELKNNKSVLIRTCVLEDAPQLLNLIQNYLDDSPFVPKSSTEFSLTLAEEEGWIESFLRAENSLLLVAEFENQLIGNIDLSGNRRKVMHHNALIGMGLSKNWRNVGLGFALLNASVAWAKSNPLLENLQLEVYAENQQGIAIYQKCGFVRCGVIPNLFKENGVYSDSIMMTLSVKNQ